MTITTPRARLSAPRSPGTWVVLLAAIGDWGRTLRLCLILVCANAPLIVTIWLIHRPLRSADRMCSTR